MLIVIKLIRRLINLYTKTVRCDDYTEVCNRCGLQHDEVWYVSDNIWYEVVGSTGGILCIRCFNYLFKERCKSESGGFRFLYWSCKEHEFPEQQTLFPK